METQYQIEGIFIKEEIKEDFYEDPYAEVKDEPISTNISARVVTTKETVEICHQSKDIEESMIKEEVKDSPEKDLFLNKNEEIHHSKSRIPLKRDHNDVAIENWPQEKVKSPSLKNEEQSWSSSNLDIFDGRGNLPLGLQTAENLLNTTSYQARRQIDIEENFLNIGKIPFKCNFCPYEGKQRSNLLRHLKTHTDEKPFKCTFCAYQAREKINLQAHLRTHTGEKPFNCNSCPYEARERSSLQKHVRTHTGEKPFKCSFCPYEASQKSNLQKHVRIHSDEKPFKCTFCPYETTQRSNLQKHVRIHSDEKPFKCTFCPYRARQRICLQKHLKTHSNIQPSMASHPS